MVEKSYLTNDFIKEIFTVYERMACQMPVFKLYDDTGEILDGTFYEAELQKVIKKDDVCCVENVLRKRKHKEVVEYFVEWKRYPDNAIVVSIRFQRILYSRMGCLNPSFYRVTGN